MSPSRLTPLLLPHIPPGAPATFFVEEFYPLAQTVEAYYMGNTLAPPNEEVLWSLGLQVLAALHAVHNAGAAVNTLDPSRVLLTERGTRARISGAAVADVLRPEVQAAATPAVCASRDL